MVKFITSYSVCNVMRQLILAVKIVSLCTRVLGRVIVAVEVHISSEFSRRTRNASRVDDSPGYATLSCANLELAEIIGL